MIRRLPEPRRGVASVELALVFMFFVIPLMLGVFEIGRLVQVQQIVSNAAREGARLAAQANTIASNGTPTQIYATTAAGTPSVQAAVYNYLIAAGLTNLTAADVQVAFAFTTPTAAGTYPADPYLGEKNQTFTVTVSIPWSSVRWVNLGFLPTGSMVTYTVTWQMLIDDAFSVSTALPAW